jgi:hypothetical protein
MIFIDHCKHNILLLYFYNTLLCMISVKMFNPRRQYAWVVNWIWINISQSFLNFMRYFSKYKITTHQRLNKEYLDINKSSRGWFEQWLVGFSDGDGTFYIAYQNNKWNLVYKITQSRYNLRVLFYIKRQLGVGSISKDNKKAQFVIRDRNKLYKFIFPIFDKYSLISSKEFDYLKLKRAFFILENNFLSKEEKDHLLKNLKQQNLPTNYISNNLNKLIIPNKTTNDIKLIITKPWLIGFTEAKGSFYLVSKDKTRIVHGFGITQKLDYLILDSIKHILGISSSVKYNSEHNFYSLDTTSSRSINNIIKFFSNTLKGMKSVEFRIWQRSYIKNKGNYKKLKEIRNILRKMNTKLLDIKTFKD